MKHTKYLTREGKNLHYLKCVQYSLVKRQLIASESETTLKPPQNRIMKKKLFKIYVPNANFQHVSPVAYCQKAALIKDSVKTV